MSQQSLQSMCIRESPSHGLSNKEYRTDRVITNVLKPYSMIETEVESVCALVSVCVRMRENITEYVVVTMCQHD